MRLSLMFCTFCIFKLFDNEHVFYNQRKMLIFIKCHYYDYELPRVCGHGFAMKTMKNFEMGKTIPGCLLDKI